MSSTATKGTHLAVDLDCNDLLAVHLLDVRSKVLPRRVVGHKLFQGAHENPSKTVLAIVLLDCQACKLDLGREGDEADRADGLALGVAHKERDVCPSRVDPGGQLT